MGYFLHFYPLTTQKIKISKVWKKHLEISSVYTCVLKIMIRWYTVPEIWCATDGRTDGRADGKKWHIEVGAPPNNISSFLNSWHMCKRGTCIKQVKIWYFFIFILSSEDGISNEWTSPPWKKSSPVNNCDIITISTIYK